MKSFNEWMSDKDDISSRGLNPNFMSVKKNKREVKPEDKSSINYGAIASDRKSWHKLEIRDGWISELMQKGFSKEEADDFLDRIGYHDMEAPINDQ